MEFKSALMTALNVTRAKAQATGNHKAVERVHRAFGICQTAGGLNDYMQSHEHHISIRDGKLVCSCEDFTYRYSEKRGYRGPCKHIIALRMYLEAFLKSNGITEFEFEVDRGVATLHWPAFSYAANGMITMGTSIAIERLLAFKTDMLKAWMVNEQSLVDALISNA